MKKTYSIGYLLSSDNHFTKVWDKNGYTLKFATVEECRKWIADCKINSTTFKIMQGWNVIEVINKK